MVTLVGMPTAQAGSNAPEFATPVVILNADGTTATLGGGGASDLPIQGVIPMTVGTPITPQRGIRIKCTTAGNVSLTYKDGSIDVIPVNAGVTEIGGAISTINTSGTTASATYSALV